MEHHTAERFKRFMETLEDSSVPTSRLIKIVDGWIESEFLDASDREWLNDHCGARTFRLNPFSPIDPGHAVVEHYLVVEKNETFAPRTMPMQELEAAAVNLFIEFLQEHYRKADDEKRPRIKRCICCALLFRTFQGYPDRVACSKSCTHRNWQKSRGLESTPRSPKK